MKKKLNPNTEQALWDELGISIPCEVSKLVEYGEQYIRFEVGGEKFEIGIKKLKRK